MPDISPAAPSGGRPLEQRLAIYNAMVVTVGALLAAIAWVPDFEGKQQELSAFALLKDNPAGVLTVRDLGAVGAGLHRYDVSYTLLLKNTSNGPFHIAWSLDQLFLGTRNAASGGGPDVINDPPNVWDPPPRGMLAWRELRYDLALEDDLDDRDVDRFFHARRKVQTSPGGGLTGPFVPGHVSGHTARYIVVADPESFVNVTITYGMSHPLGLWQRIRGEKFSSLDEGANLVGETVRLADAVQPGCRLGIAVQNAQITSACGSNPL